MKAAISRPCDRSAEAVCARKSDRNRKTAHRSAPVSRARAARPPALLQIRGAMSSCQQRSPLASNSITSCRGSESASASAYQPPLARGQTLARQPMMPLAQVS